MGIQVPPSSWVLHDKQALELGGAPSASLWFFPAPHPSRDPKAPVSFHFPCRGPPARLCMVPVRTPQSPGDTSEERRESLPEPAGVEGSRERAAGRGLWGALGCVTPSSL